MITVAVLIPTTGRAEQLEKRVSELLMQTPPLNVQVAVVLAIPAGDTATWNAATRLQVGVMHLSCEVHTVTRANDTNAVEGWLAAYEYARFNGADWYVLGADDIVWGWNWLTQALRVAEKTGALVIGLNDGHTNLDDYAPHYMMNQLYADEFGFIPSGYQSWWFDREVCQKAQSLGLYAPAWEAKTEHKHPDWRTAEMDETYRQAWPLHNVDAALYEQRKARMWT